jgi:hypothetical protein
MKKLLRTFKKTFGMPFPAGLIPEEIGPNLIPLDGNSTEKSMLVGSSEASRFPHLIQGEIPRFIESGPKGYFLIGFWRHGVNSYAFYFSRVDSWSRILFRLPHGGIYEDNEKNAHLIGLFLLNFLFFEKRIRGKSKNLIAIDSMGGGYYKLTKMDGTTVELKDSLFMDLDFGIKLDC